MYQGKLAIRLFGLDAHQARLIESLAPPAGLGLDVALIEAAHDLAASLADADIIIAAVADAGALGVLDGVLDAARSTGKTRAALAATVHPTSMLQLLPAPGVVVAAPTTLAPELAGRLEHIEDLWPWPLADDELAFRMTRLLERRGRDIDAWQTSQYLEATINSTPSLVWFKTRDGVHEKVNDSFCKTVAKTKEQVEGQRHAYIWDVEEDDPACIESEERVMSLERTCVAEESVQTGEGEPRLLTTYKSPLYDIDGTVMGTLGVAIDITQERAYEQSLIEKNHSLETIFTSLECGVLTHSVDGSRIVGVNQAALNILGYETEEELMAAGFDLVAPTVLDEDKKRMREVMASLNHIGDSASIEYRVKRDDGELTYVIGNIKLIEQNGEPLYQRFLLDYSEEKIKQAQSEVRQRDRIRALSEDYVAVCAFDLDTDEGEVLRVSSERGSEFTRVFGSDLSYSRVMDAYIEHFVSEADRAHMREALAPARIIEELGQLDRYEVLYRVHQDGEDVYYTAAIVRSGAWDAGQNHQVVIGLRNVDKQKREEMERKEMLEDALVQATRASEAKSAFLTNMSHDIRTPLNAIIGFTNLAQTRLGNAELMEEYLGKIQTSSKHLLNLINDVLDMSRIESGKSSIELDACEFYEIIEELGDVMRLSVEEKGLELSVDATGIERVPVLCDRLKVMQILINLAGNAIKFTEPGGSISVLADELTEHAPGCRRYRVSISDTGIGMDPSFIEHVFDAFERERTSTISGTQGTGLGMAITKSLVTMMGGSIEVESEKGVGTTFTVYLTFDVADGVDDEVACGEEQGGAEEHHAIGNPADYRLLLVEDNALNREIALTILRDAGFEVEHACDGQEAVDLVAGGGPGHFDAVLMDIQMPVMNGYEAASAIRALDDPALSAIPILAVTADAFESDRQKAMQAGMNGHLSKPFQVEELFDALKGLLG